MQGARRPLTLRPSRPILQLNLSILEYFIDANKPLTKC
jgi:hypothetical protein